MKSNSVAVSLYVPSDAETLAHSRLNYRSAARRQTVLEHLDSFLMPAPHTFMRP